MKRFIALLIVAVLVTFSLSAFAQESSVKGNLSGTVYDSTGAVVAGAKVTMSGPIGAKQVDTDNQGAFMFPLLTPGFYTVKVEKQGFKATETKGIEIVTNKTVAVRLTLEPGAVSEVVEVSAPAITVDTSTTAVGSNLTDSFYSQVPIARNVTGLFYVAPGAVSSGSNTTRGNPSISGGSGLENQYVADGVNITDGAFGGLGVFSRIYGSLSTGINLSFVQEVQVKTGGYEPQYGKATGGVVQIVTKSGTANYHGSVGAYFQPQGLEAERLLADFGGEDPSQARFNMAGQVRHQAAFDISGEVGGYVPGLKDKLFFFGSFNPSWTRDYGTFTQLHDVPLFLTGPSGGLGDLTTKATAYNYAAKLTWKINANHTLEGSVFGDPSRTPTQNGAPGQAFWNVISPTTFDTLSFGTRNVVVRWNGTLSPTWLMNASGSWGHNYLTDTPAAPDLYQVSSNINCIKSDNGTPNDPTDDGVLVQGDNPPGCYSSAFPIGDPHLTFGQVNPQSFVGLGHSTGGFAMQGFGYGENTEGDNYGFSLDTQKQFHFLGSHNFSIGYKLDRNFYDGLKFRTGPGTDGLVPCVTEDYFGAGDATAAYGGAAGQAALAASPGCNWGSIQMRSVSSYNAAAPSVAAQNRFPIFPMPDGSMPHVRLLPLRGEFGTPQFFTAGTYHAIYGMDSWSPWKYLTINAGLRWEQQYMQGNFAHYTWVGNWSPRIGVTVDPWGDRKTKVYVNFGRYNYAIPLDMAIRSLSTENDNPLFYFTPLWQGEDLSLDPTVGGNGFCPSPCAALVQLNPDGTIPNPRLDNAHAYTYASTAGLSTGTAISPGTKMESLDEWVVGFERDFGHGVIFSARYIDRRMKRIVEDMAALSPEAYAVLNQQYLIGNPSPKLDIFTNPIEVKYPAGGVAPAQCSDPNLDAGDVVDTFGNVLGAMCIVPGPYANGAQPGDIVPDGIPDGFPQPVRNYQAMEFEVNKSFSKNWQLRSNYRIARLKGNYEGAFRNDNGQTDPSISSLFDFTAGEFNLLGDQFALGYLNTDRRHVVNTYFSYVFDKSFLKGLTLGTGLNVQSGTPINDLKAHPAYLNSGEIPVNGRGSLGRLPTTGQVDIHADYAFNVTEKSKLRFGIDMFNLVNMKRQTNIDQNEDRSFGVPNVDFKHTVGTYTGFQRPFYARLMAKWEF